MKKFLLLSLFITLISACNNKKEPTITTQAEFKPITLGTMSTMESLPFIVAQKQGIYDSLGLKVNFIRFKSANDRDASFQAGEIDGTITDYPSAARLQRHNPGLSLVMENDGYFCFIVDKKSGINQLSQLKSKNIGISYGTVIDYATDEVCKKADISPEEINKPEIAQIPLRLNMLQYGQIEATFLPDPYASIAMSNGGKSLISTRELGISITGTAFCGKALKEKRAEIALLIEGYNLGVKHIQICPQKELTALLVEETGIPENLAGLIALPTYKPATRPAEVDIDKIWKWLKDKKMIPDNYPVTNLVDTTFAIPNANNKY